MRQAVNHLKELVANRLQIPASVLTITSPERPYALLVPFSDGPITYDSGTIYEPISVDVVIYAGDPDTAMEYLDRLTDLIVELDDTSFPIAGLRVSKVLPGSNRSIQPIAGEPNNYVARQNVRITTEAPRRK